MNIYVYQLSFPENGIGPKSYSLGGTAAAQLSASVRERLLGSQSLPKPGTHEFAALFHHHRYLIDYYFKYSTYLCLSRYYK